jgi:IclR family acetate operon transcriptional repressor
MRSSDRILEIVEALALAEEVTLTELAGAIDLPVPTVLRLLRALEERGWVSRLPSGAYALGPQFLATAGRALQRDPLIAAAQKHLADLSRELDETVSLSVAAAGTQRACLVEFESSQSLRYVHGVGSLGPLAAGATGKVLLAFGNPKLLDEVCAGPLERYTEITLDADGLRSACAEVRKQRWAVSLGERSRGAFALSIPLVSPHTRTLYALTVFAPGPRVAPGSRDEWLLALERTRDAIVSQLVPVKTRDAL